MLRGLWEFLVSLVWVGGALTFSSISIAAVIGIAFLIRLAFPFLPDVAVGFGFLLALAIYILVVGWIAWTIFQRRSGV